MPVPSPQPTCAELARLLRAARLDKQWPLALVAEKAGLSYQMVSYVERSLRIPTLDSFLRICAALDLDPAELFRSAQPRRGRRR